jgi:hypothetical protein
LHGVEEFLTERLEVALARARCLPAAVLNGGRHHQ